MRSRRAIRASDYQCQSHSPGLDPSILRQWNLRCEDEAVLNKVHKKIQKPISSSHYYIQCYYCILRICDRLEKRDKLSERTYKKQD